MEGGDLGRRMAFPRALATTSWIWRDSNIMFLSAEVVLQECGPEKQTSIAHHLRALGEVTILDGAVHNCLSEGCHWKQSGAPKFSRMSSRYAG